jgi:hypothetical protein
MDTFYMQAVAVLLGLVVGLWLRRLVRGLFTLTALAGVLALVLIATGRGGMLETNRDFVPQAMTIGLQLINAVRQVLIGMPGALAGLLLGVAIREVVALAKA